ncbi:MAG: hypothetical protein AABX47_05875 [Nanoarchaeota archaeon]
MDISFKTNGRPIPEGRKLIEIIERHDWTLIDITRPTRETFLTDHYIDTAESATDLVIDHNYLFVPIPRQGQLVSAAYEERQGLRPALEIENIYDDRWAGESNVSLKGGRYLAVFNMMLLIPEFNGVIVTSPKDSLNANPDTVGIIRDYLVDSFSRYFRIVQPEDLIRIQKTGQNAN